MKRALKYFSSIVVLLLLLSGGLVFYLVSTTGGARWLLNLTAVGTGMVLQWEELQGSLLDGIEARGVSGSREGTTWSLAQLTLQWQPWRLRDRALVIDLLQVSGISVRSQPSAGEPMTAEALQARLFGLPVTIELAQLRVNDFSFASGESAFAFDSLSGAATLDSTRATVTDADFRSGNVTVTGQANLDASLALGGDLQWQVSQDERDYAGTLALGGTLQELDVQHSLLAPVQLTSSGQLQPAMFANETLRFDLQHEFPLQSLAVVNQPDARFAGRLRTTGIAEDGGFDAQVQLTGTVQDYPLSLDGRINMRTDRTFDVNVNASSGSNTLSVLGSLGQTLTLDWQVQAPALEQLLPMLAGSLNGSGQLSGTRTAPEVTGSLNGEQLGFQQEGNRFLLDTLALTASYGPQGNDLQLQLGTLRRDGADGATTLLQRASATLTGTPEQHSVNASVVAAPAELQVAASGSYVDGAWSGTLATTRLRSTLYGDWELVEPTAASYAQQAVNVAQHCWRHLQLLLCLEGEFHPERGLDAELAVDGLALDWFNAEGLAQGKPQLLQSLQDDNGIYLPQELRVTGTVDVRVTTAGLRDLRNGSLDVVLLPHDVELQWEPQNEEQPEQSELLRQHLALTVDRSELHLRDGTWSADAAVDVAREADGNWIPQGTLQGSGSLGSDDVVDATLEFSFADLTWLETAVPELRATAGRLTGTAMVAGSRTEPRLQLEIQLADGRFDVPEYGLQIRELTLGMTTLPDASVQVTGSATSGPGTVNLQARIMNPLQPVRSFNADVDASNLLVVDIPAVRTHLNSDLQLDYNSAGLAVKGSVEMLDAEFDLEGLFRSANEGAIPVSGDVVIVRGAPENTSLANTRQDIPLAIDLIVKAGDDVHVSGYDLEATLNGELSLQQTPGQSLLVYGELGIPQGRYSIYNQELNAEDGRLMFFGNPTNPVLDLRAFRTTSSAEVGVWLNGPVSEIRGELYSTPALPSNEILSLLVTGKSFSQTSSQDEDALLGAVASFGLGRSEGLTDRVGTSLGLDTLTLGGDSLTDSALGLGKYLTPNLLVRYKVGLFDRQSVLGVEYTLNEHIRLKVESGISQSLELSYTIEKD